MFYLKMVHQPEQVARTHVGNTKKNAQVVGREEKRNSYHPIIPTNGICNEAWVNNKLAKLQYGIAPRKELVLWD